LTGEKPTAKRGKSARAVPARASGFLPEDLVDTGTLCLRLNALLDALGNLDKQAKRLKRAQARRKLSRRLSGQGVLRIYRPPSHRENGGTVDEVEVDEILRSLQYFAREWIAANDTS
jgi:hypothetical protein